ncbi:MAG: hypothetical protein RDU20_19660 [Desulfomonilaceae bacterium]|nr:hypothetical protein [Desulfomonilaceae bacterium]
MPIVGKCAQMACFLVVIVLASITDVQSQDIFREMNQVKSDLSTLKNEVNDLKTLVYELRRFVLEQALATDGRLRRTVEADDRVSEVRKPSPEDERQITEIACRAVGQFFEEAESALRSRDSSAARTKMNDALGKLTSALSDYSRTHRVTKLLSIYDGLAWNTYTAVQLRQSITGNQDFLDKLRQHKQKYIETCPKE